MRIHKVIVLTALAVFNLSLAGCANLQPVRDYARDGLAASPTMPRDKPRGNTALDPSRSRKRSVNSRSI